MVRKECVQTQSAQVVECRSKRVVSENLILADKMRLECEEAVKKIAATLGNGATIGKEALQTAFDMSNQRTKFLVEYHYKLFQRADGYWQTTNAYGDTPKKVKAKTKEELIDKLIVLKKGQGNSDITVEKLYRDYMNGRIAAETDNNTVKRDQQRYERYFAGTPFFQRKVRSLTMHEWEEFCLQVVLGKTTKDRSGAKKGSTDEDVQSFNEGHLTAKEWSSTRCILNGMMQLAVSKGIIEPHKNYLSFVKISDAKYRPEPDPEDDEVIFTDAEQRALLEWCYQKYAETKKAAYLFPPLSLELGARIGELSALKFSDISWSKNGYPVLLFYKMEYKDKITKTVYVVDRTKVKKKAKKKREVLLSDTAIMILNELRENKSENDWIFTFEGKRCTSRQLNYVLEKYARDNNLDIKASHSLRKTCGSNLRRKGFSPRQCSNILGNTEEVFLKYYSRDTSDIDWRIKAINAPSVCTEIGQMYLKAEGTKPQIETSVEPIIEHAGSVPKYGCHRPSQMV